MKVDIGKKILIANEEYAFKNSTFLAEQKKLCLNMISSPGSGKTTILVRTITELKDKIKIGVIEGDIKTDTEVDKILFNLLTNISIDEVKSQTGLVFTIINGFSGNLALQLNYGFATSLFGTDPQNGEPVMLRVINPFVLSEFTSRLVHDGRLKLTYEEVANVKSKCSERIEVYKQIVPNVYFHEGLEKSFPKKFVKVFRSLFDELPTEFQSLYYCSFILSSILSSDKHIQREVRLRRFMADYVEIMKSS